MNTENEMILHPLTPGELAALYRVCTKTLKKWTDRHGVAIGQRVGRFYSTAQLRKIYECLGPPAALFKE